MCHLQVEVGFVRVAYDRVAVRPDRYRGVFADAASAVDGGKGVAGGAARVAAVGHPQVEVGTVQVADDRLAVVPNRYSGVVTRQAGAVDGGKGVAGGAARVATV